MDALLGFAVGILIGVKLIMDGIALIAMASVARAAGAVISKLGVGGDDRVRR